MSGLVGSVSRLRLGRFRRWVVHHEEGDMHELPVTQGLCDLVVREATQAGADKVCSIIVKMGLACDYVPEILQEYFNVLSEGTVAQGAVIHIINVPITMRCEECRNEYETPHYNPFCPRCHGNHTTMLTGREFYVDNIEVEGKETETV